MSNQPNSWHLFTGEKDEKGKIKEIGLAEDALPDSPPWRPFSKEASVQGSRRQKRGETFQIRPEEIDMVNAALYLRRPLLITGAPGTGKSSLAYAVARQLGLGEVLYWSITTRTTLKDGLYSYDAIGRLQEVKQGEDKDIGKYITLGPLGTALLPSTKPRVLLIDEIDKSDIDLPNDLLTIFEEGKFRIPELERIKEDNPKIDVTTAYTDSSGISDDPANASEHTARATDKLKETVENGVVNCTSFPFVVLTSNGERDFPAPFLRRCLCLTMKYPDEKMLAEIVNAHFGAGTARQKIVKALIKDFHDRLKQGATTLATDQLLNAVFMVTSGKGKMTAKNREFLVQRLTVDLSTVEDEFE